MIHGFPSLSTHTHTHNRINFQRAPFPPRFHLTAAPPEKQCKRHSKTTTQATDSSSLSSSFSFSSYHDLSCKRLLLVHLLSSSSSHLQQRKMLPSIAVQQPVCPMIPKLCASLAVSPPSPDSLEGHGESAKWMRGCWWSRSLSFGSLLMLTMLLISIVLLEFHTQVASPWRVSGLFKPSSVAPMKLSTQNPCEKASGRYKRMGIDTLPRGIVQETTDLQFRALGADPVKETQWLPSSQSLLTMPVGVQQKEMVNKIIEKFPEQNFTVMLFHYDGKVDEWKTFPWSNRAIHVAAANQTKWYCPCSPCCSSMVKLAWLRAIASLEENLHHLAMSAVK